MSGTGLALLRAIRKTQRAMRLFQSRPSLFHPARILSFNRVKMCRALVAILLVVFIVTTAVISSRLPCVHGTWEGNRCVCNYDYVGDRCHRKMHCATYMRHDNGSCKGCMNWWNGTNCDEIYCHPKFGNATEDLLMCECTEPAIGIHCSNLTTANIYLHYNRRMAEFWGPLGALSIIPMVLCFFMCERSADKRQEKRIEKALSDMKEGEVNSQAVKELLEREPKGP